MRRELSNVLGATLAFHASATGLALSPQNEQWVRGSRRRLTFHRFGRRGDQVTTCLEPYQGGESANCGRHERRAASLAAEDYIR